MLLPVLPTLQGRGDVCKRRGQRRSGASLQCGVGEEKPQAEAAVRAVHQHNPVCPCAHPMLPRGSVGQAASPCGTHSTSATKGQPAPVHVACVAGLKVCQAAAAAEAAMAGGSTPCRTAPTAAKLELRCWQ